VPNVAADLCRPSHGDRSTASGPSAGRAGRPDGQGETFPPPVRRGSAYDAERPPRRSRSSCSSARHCSTGTHSTCSPCSSARSESCGPSRSCSRAATAPGRPLPPSRQRRHPGGGRAARAVPEGAAADRRAGAGRDHRGHQRPRNPALEDVCNEFAGQLTWTWTPVASKRNAARIGVEMASGEVVVLLDSDTIWTEGTLAELLKPFTDPPRGRRDHQAAHPRPRAQPPHPVGGLAGEQGPAEPSRPSRTRHHRRPGTNL
jgi:hypothetical protein